MFSFLPLGCTPPCHFRKFLVCTLLLFQSAATMQAKKASAGLAWHVLGTWQIAGKRTPVRAGDAIEPASLLQPDETTDGHSITILLPDGQRILYECFTATDCARGFRVPSLIRRPDPFALDMLARIGAILSNSHSAALNERRAQHAPQTARQEAVAVLDASHCVRIGGLIADLPNGRYTYDLRPRNRDYPPQFRLTLDKTAPSIELALPGTGIYDITITDALNTPRIDLFLTTIRPSQSADILSFRHARALMERWNDDYTGWPIDDFLRAYLESLVQSANH
jgi:hypothetical protein